MSEERLLYALSQVDDHFITESAPGKIPPKKIPWIKWASLAACLCILLCVAIHFFQPTQNCPPIWLSIKSISELEYLLNSATLPDDELQNYLETHGYNANFIYDREDLNRILSPFIAVGCPIPLEPERVTDFRVLYYIGDRHQITYSIDGVLYSFEYSVCEAKALRPFRIPAKSVNIGGNSVDLYWGYQCLVGELYSGDHQVRIVARSFSNIDDVNFDHFKWQFPTNSNTTD